MSGPNLDGQGSADSRGRGSHWEYYERGGWKPCSEYINSLLEEGFLSGAESCSMNIDDTGDAKYEWNFPALTQKRKHRQNGQWAQVKKTRSIRRVSVLAAPMHPVG